MKNKILLALIPFSEMKAVFYQSNLRVKYALFSDNKHFLCNVVEDYSNIIILGVIFWYISFVKFDINTKRIALFLFIINALDLMYLGLMDNLLYLTKIPLSIIIYAYAHNKVSFQRS